jgi:agmatinase
MTFDPNAPAALSAGIYGLPHTQADARLVYLPVPWEATTSYGGGTSKGPGAILAASRQVDLYDLDVARPYEPGLFMLPEDPRVHAWNEAAKAHAARVIEAAAQGGGDEAELAAARAEVLRLSGQMNAFVELETARLLRAGKIVGVIGGDHSVPLGAMRAMSSRVGSFGVLHFDAHSDTRRAYEGFLYSHASIMWNVLATIPNVSRLVQVGIRDVCEEEVEYVASQDDRVKVFFDREIARARMLGEPFDAVARRVVEALPERVWISFDIDGLDPRFCPHTGTPVPGGLDLAEAVHVMIRLVQAGKRVIGFDLSEVSPDLANPADEWDANVGARLLYKMSGLTLASQGLRELR